MLAGQRPNSLAATARPNPSERDVRLSARLAGALDRSSPVPLYYQLAQALEAAIDGGDAAAGSHLEDEITLSRELGVSRPTVRRAIAYLAGKGMLIRRRGIGTLVVPVRVKRSVALSSLYDDLSDSGRVPTTRVLTFETVPASVAVAEAMKLGVGEAVHHFTRLRMVGDEPIALMDNFVAGDVPLDRDELERSGFYRILRAVGIHLQIASQTIGARRARDDESRLLGIGRQVPVLTMRRVSYDDSGRAIELGSHVYPADRYSFEISLVSDNR